MFDAGGPLQLLDAVEAANGLRKLVLVDRIVQRFAGDRRHRASSATGRA